MNDPIESNQGAPAVTQPAQPYAPGINPIPAVTTTAPQPVTAQPPASPFRNIPKNAYIIGGIILAAIILITVFYIRSLNGQDAALPPLPTPAPAPTPTPMRVPSRVASTSAFAEFQYAVASLSATINGFTILDSTLTPPILNVDLGLSP